AWNNGLKQFTDFFIQFRQAGAEFLMVIGGEIPRLDLEGKRGERSPQGGNGPKKFFRVHVARFVDVAHYRQTAIYGKKQPKAGNIGSREIRKIRTALAAPSRENATF